MEAEVRETIEKLAQHAAASSTGVSSFVAFVRSNQHGNPLFSFLSPGDAHHAAWEEALARATSGAPTAYSAPTAKAKFIPAPSQPPKLGDEEKEEKEETEEDRDTARDEEPATSIPTRLIPAVVEDNLRWSDPYTPADALSIEMASKSTRSVEVDEYLTLRLECFQADLEEYERRPGVSYSAARDGMGVPVGRRRIKEDSVSVSVDARARARGASDGSFRGGRGGREKGLGFHRSSAGREEAALDEYRSMKKRGARYGAKLNVRR